MSAFRPVGGQWTIVSIDGVATAQCGGFEVGLSDNGESIWVHDTTREFPNGCFVPVELVESLKRANDCAPDKSASYLAELNLSAKEKA